MAASQLSYLVFILVVALALLFDLGLLSKKNQSVSMQKALLQTVFWIVLAIGFFVFMWIENGRTVALQYISAYLMEWSLSVDNIFVFIIIFNAFKVKEIHYGRVLLAGILMAIFCRIIFITVGVALVHQFEWILYLFGAFLLYTGYKMFTANEEQEMVPQETKVYLWLKKYLPLAAHDGGGRYVVRENGRPVYTTLFVVIVLLAVVDLVFALDSIPAVMGISLNRMVIYTSNIFAVLGLRSLFFLLRSAVSKFDYLQQGIAFVLIFIGSKMLAEPWIVQWIDSNTQVVLSLLVIVSSIAGSILYSIYHQKRGVPQDIR